MSTDKPLEKRISWLVGATFLNTLLSLVAIGLWFFGPNRSSVPQASSPQASAPAGPIAARPPPNWNRFPRRTPDDASSTPIPPNELPSVRFDPRQFAKIDNANVTPSTKALAERIRTRPESLAQTFSDESGEIPRPIAQRLEHAFDAAKSLAQRRNLNESQTQSITAVLTDYEFSVLREEKAAGSGPADPTRLESIREEALNSIEVTCGEEIRKAAEDEIKKW